jgi:hypothetical protein
VRRHWALAVLLACTTPLLLAFAWQEGLASVSDDSASYLVLAQAIAGGNPAVLPWVGYHTHFPPLFPLALAATGGAADFRYAHALVSLFVAGGALAGYAFAWRETGRRDAALATAAAFLACPTTWVSDKGILSEPMFLCASLATLLYFQWRLERARFDRGEPGMRPWLTLGLLLAAAVLTRVMGAALVVGLLIHLAVRARRGEALPGASRLAAAFTPPALLVLAWVALRPVAAQDSYQRVSTSMAHSWTVSTGVMGQVSVKTILDGWVASFTADANVGFVGTAVALLIAALALTGLVRRLLANRLDAWYVAVSLPVVCWWVFNEDNTRRLLFPLLPLLLFYAGEAIVAACALAGRSAYAIHSLGAAGAVLAIVVVPTALVMDHKARDRQPVVEGFAPRYADITEYYTTLNVAFSRRLAARQGVILAGFDALRKGTPPEARVMWMRPEYPALLGGRAGVPWYYDWDPMRVARTARDEHVDYVVSTPLFKSDLAGGKGDPAKPLAGVEAWTRPVMAFTNPASGTRDFVLLEVDRAALDAWIAGRGAS